MTVVTKIKTPAVAIENGVAQTKEQLETFVNAGREQALKQFEQGSAALKEQLEKTTARLFKSYEDIQVLSKGNAEALIESSTTAAKGAEDLGREVVAYTQASFEKSISTGKALLAAKSLQEVVELQNSYFKSSLDGLVSEANRLQELSVKVTNAALAPLNARFNVAVETLSKPVAA